MRTAPNGAVLISYKGSFSRSLRERLKDPIKHLEFPK